MRYHILVANSFPPSIEDCSAKTNSLKILKDIYATHSRHLHETLENLTKISAKKFLRKRADQQRKLLASLEDYPQPYFWYDAGQMRELALMLKEDDTLVFHGEGNPFIFGLEEPSHYDLSPLKFARMFNDYEFSHELSFNIEFVSCNIASNWQGINFTHLVSLGLSVLYSYPRLNITGCAAYVVEKEIKGKFSASLEHNGDPRISHLALSLVMNSYQAGEQKVFAKSSAVLEDYVFDFALPYIAICTEEIATIVHRKASIYLEEYLHPENLTQAQENFAFFQSIQFKHLMKLIFSKTVDIDKMSPEGKERWLAPLREVYHLKFAEFKASDAFGALMRAQEAQSAHGLWAHRDDSSKNREEFDRQYGLTVI